MRHLHQKIHCAAVYIRFRKNNYTVPTYDRRNRKSVVMDVK